MDQNKKTIRKIAMLGIGIALYVVLSLVMNIPLLAGTHLQTDLGYIAFGAFCYLIGWEAFIVGTLGCFFKSLVISAWIPIGWMLGQIAIGLVCGIVYKRTEKRWIHIVVTIIMVFIGVGLIKTSVECALYSLPFAVKLAKNSVAFVADVIPMLIGLFLGYYLKKLNINSNDK